MPRVFGPIEGTTVGQSFKDRASVSTAGVHRPLVAGISGSSNEGADSIVLNGGYVHRKSHFTCCQIVLAALGNLNAKRAK